MKTKLSILSATLFILIFSSSAFAYDLTGMWDVTYFIKPNNYTVKQLIKQNGDTFTLDFLLSGTIEGDTYKIPGPIPGRRNVGRAWIQVQEIEFTPSDENNFKGRQTINAFASEKAEQSRQMGFTIVGVRIKDPDPRIVPKGSLDMYIKTGTPFTDPGILAHDGAGNMLTDSVVTTGAVDSGTPGAYKLAYNVTDANGKKASEVIRTVHVVNAGPPTLTLKGDANEFVTKGTLYADPGATAVNFLNENLTDKIKTMVNGKPADLKKPGVIVTTTPETIYKITYEVQDDNGKTEKIRTVTVKASEDEKSFWQYCFISTLSE